MGLPRLLTLDEVAAATRATKGTVQSWIYSGKLATVKPGRHRLVTEAELLRFLRLDVATDTSTHPRRGSSRAH